MRRQVIVRLCVTTCIGIGGAILSGCGPSKDQLATQTAIGLTATFEAAPTVTPTPTSTATLTSTPTVTRTPTSTSTPTKTEVPPTRTATATEIPPTKSADTRWCSKNAGVKSLHQTLLKLDSITDPLEKISMLDKFITRIFLLGDDPRTNNVEPLMCGFSTVTSLKQPIRDWGYTQKQVDACKVLSLEPLYDLNNPDYWKISPNTQIRLDFGANKQCRWVTEPITDQIRDLINKK